MVSRFGGKAKPPSRPLISEYLNRDRRDELTAQFNKLSWEERQAVASKHAADVHAMNMGRVQIGPYLIVRVPQYNRASPGRARSEVIHKLSAR